MSRMFTEAPMCSSVFNGSVSSSSPAVVMFFAKIPGTDIEARVSQCIEQFARDEADLPQVRRPRVSARQISMPDKLAVVGVAFDAISCRENDGEPWSLAEPVLGVDRYGDD